MEVSGRPLGVRGGEGGGGGGGGVGVAGGSAHTDAQLGAIKQNCKERRSCLLEGIEAARKNNYVIIIIKKRVTTLNLCTLKKRGKYTRGGD